MKCQSCKVKGYKYEQNSSSVEVLQVDPTLQVGAMVIVTASYV